MADSRCEELLRISGQAFERFRPYRDLCQDIAENFYPMRADFTRTLDLQEFAGNLMDGTPLNARETLANAIDSMLRQGPWFAIGTGDEERDKRPGNMVALERATKAFRSVIYHPHSGIADALKEWDNDWVTFGSFAGTVEASRDRTHLVFKPRHLRDCAWLQNEDREIDTHFYNLRMSARDIMHRVRSGVWTGQVAPAIVDAERRDPTREFLIRHILMPTEDLYGGSHADMKRIRFPYNSIYIDVENRTYLNETGAPFFNCVVGRHRTLAHLPYGLSPMALNSLADARMLQDMSLVILEQGQKAVDPPTIGAQQVFTRDINLFSGGHTEVDLEEGQSLKDVFSTVETGNVRLGFELKQDVRALIAESWLLNKLTLPSVREMRELEVQVRTDEFRRAALPFFAPIEPNYHGLVLGTAYDLSMHLGYLSPQMLNRELMGRPMNFTYQSPLNEAEGAEIVRKYYESVNIVSVGAQVDKTVATIFDLRKAAEEAIARGSKPEWLIPEEKREAAAQEADAAQQFAKSAQIAREAAGVTADVSNASMAAQQAGLADAAAA